jgi:hypothetical protein
MTKRTIITVIVLAVILGIIFLIQQLNREEEQGNNAVLSVSAYNQTKNDDAAKAAANPKDVIVYTLTAENQSNEPIRGFVFETNIADITELATLIDAQGANYNSGSNSLVWTPIDIPENGSVEKKFTVRIKDELPANSDLTMAVKFNNEVKVSVVRSVATNNNGSTRGASTDAGSTPGRTDYTAPNTGIPFNVTMVLALCATLGIFLFRLAHKLGRPTQ